jgi:hypothetical protein
MNYLPSWDQCVAAGQIIAIITGAVSAICSFIGVIRWMAAMYSLGNNLLQEVQQLVMDTKKLRRSQKRLSVTVEENILPRLDNHEKRITILEQDP